MVGKNDSASKKTLFTSGCDLSPNSLLKDIWHWEKFNIIKLVFSILNAWEIYMDKESLMPKKKKDIFNNRSIVTSRKRLKRNQMICDYMQLIVVHN
jgi:hypothetical protein